MGVDIVNSYTMDWAAVDDLLDNGQSVEAADPYASPLDEWPTVPSYAAMRDLPTLAERIGRLEVDCELYKCLGSGISGADSDGDWGPVFHCP